MFQHHWSYDVQYDRELFGTEGDIYSAVTFAHCQIIHRSTLQINPVTKHYGIVSLMTTK